MTPAKRIRFALFKQKEATKNKVVIEVSDDEVIEDSDSEIPKGWKVEPTQKSKFYCDNCDKEIAEGGKLCDMCFVMDSYANDCELFGYNLNAPASPREE